MNEARHLLQENVPDPGKSLYSQTKYLGRSILFIAIKI